MKRRGFLGALLAIVAAPLAKLLPIPVTQPLMFHGVPVVMDEWCPHGMLIGGINPATYRWWRNMPNLPQTHVEIEDGLRQAFNECKRME